MKFDDHDAAHNASRHARPPQEQVLTTRGAAQMLGVAVSTVQQWVDSGRLRSWSTPGGHRRIPVQAVRQLMDRDEERGPSAQPALLEMLDSAAKAAPPAAGSYPVGLDETARVRAVMDSGLFDSGPQASYDRLAALAGQVAGTPLALFTLLGHERQWFKARVGLAMHDSPRWWAFCNYTVLSDQPLVVPDARQDERFCHNPFVTNEQVRFYAGYPVHDDGGHRIGALCVLDYVPRTLDRQQLWGLGELATLVSDEVARSQAGAITLPPAP